MDDLSWDAIGASAELLAAVGVLATLVFLAMQIRQTGKILERNLIAGRASAVSSSNAAMRNFRMQLAMNESSHRIWSIGLGQPKELSDIELMLFQCALETIADVYSQTMASGLAPEVWETQGRERVQFLVGTPGGQYCWEAARDSFPKDFRDAVDSEIGGFESS